MADKAAHTHRISALRAIPPCPPVAGFREHWLARRDRAAAVEPQPRLTSIGRHRGHDIFRIRFATTDELWIGGWVALPRRGTVRRGIIHSHGYGGRTQIDTFFLRRDTAILWPVARGLPTQSLMAALPSEPRDHVLVGIESPESYILGGCTEDIWCAANALTSLVGEVPLGYIGTSFGGGQGALALPWDDRFVAGALEVPSFGQYDIRLRTPCMGSGEPVRLHVQDHPEAREVLRFFDASSAALLLRIPMIVAGALTDPAVPPAGQWAVRNAIAHAEDFILTAGHMPYRGEGRESRRWRGRQRHFLNRHVR